MVQSTITRATLVERVEEPTGNPTQAAGGAADIVRELQQAALAKSAVPAKSVTDSTAQRTEDQPGQATTSVAALEMPKGATNAQAAPGHGAHLTGTGIAIPKGPQLHSLPTSGIPAAPTTTSAAASRPPVQPRPARQPSLLPPAEAAPAAPAQVAASHATVTVNHAELMEVMSVHAKEFFDVQEKRMSSMVHELAEVYRRDAQRTGELVADAVYNKANASVESVNRLMQEFRDDFGKVHAASAVMEARLADMIERAQKPLAMLTAQQLGPVDKVVTTQPMVVEEAAGESKVPDTAVVTKRGERTIPLSVGFVTPTVGRVGEKSRRPAQHCDVDVAAQLMYDDDVLSILSDDSADASYAPSGSSSDTSSADLPAAAQAAAGGTTGTRMQARKRMDSTATDDSGDGEVDEKTYPAIPLKKSRRAAAPEEKSSTPAMPSPQEV